MVLRKYLTILLLFLSTTGYAKSSVPDWTKGAVWYQILPERFRNINPSNDPIRERVVDKKVEDWQVHPWASDWYKLQIWEEQRGVEFSELISDRRYGGDLIGVIEKLPYLKDFGVNVIYLTPIFEAPSIEKYDASTFHHVDNNFGFNREEDWEKIISEKEDPESWTLTKGDEAFIELIRNAHELEIKVVIEGVFNFCGRRFFAFRDLEENQQESKYKNWFEVLNWDDPATPDTIEFDYKCWQNDKKLPVFKKDENGFLVEPVKKYIFDITRRWMDPDGDGDTVDGIDGWSLNHVEDLRPEFWNEWNKLVKSLNSKAITISDYVSQPVVEWLNENPFDLAFNDELSSLMTDFFIEKRMNMTISEFVEKLKQIHDEQNEFAQSLINKINNHRTDRVATMIVNSMTEFANGTSSGNGRYVYNPVKPDSSHRKIQKLLTIFEMTFVGAPMIFYGDESGMWGGMYPDNIKPMLWKEFIYERETYQTFRRDLKAESINRFDNEIFDLYRKLNHLRHKNPAIPTGEFFTHQVDDEKKVLVYSRKLKNNEVMVFLNLGEEKQRVELKPGWKKNLKVKEPLSNQKYKLDKFDIKLDLEPMSGRILVKEK